MVHRLLLAVLIGLVVASCAEQSPRAERSPRGEQSPHGEQSSWVALVGSRFPPLVREFRCLDGELEFGAHRFTLLRWWTDGCPHCRASLPALETLRKSVPDLQVVGVYHPKPAGEVTDVRVRAAARELGFAGPLAVDPNWSMLYRLRELGVPSRVTSLSVLVDRRGEIRWLHPGPRLHPSADGEHVQAAADYAALEVLVAADANK